MGSRLALHAEPAQMQSPRNVCLKDGFEVHSLSIKSCYALRSLGNKHVEPLGGPRLLTRANGKRHELGDVAHRTCSR